VNLFSCHPFFCHQIWVLIVPVFYFSANHFSANFSCPSSPELRKHNFNTNSQNHRLRAEGKTHRKNIENDEYFQGSSWVPKNHFFCHSFFCQNSFASFAAPSGLLFFCQPFFCQFLWLISAGRIQPQRYRAHRVAAPGDARTGFPLCPIFLPVLFPSLFIFFANFASSFCCHAFHSHSFLASATVLSHFLPAAHPSEIFLLLFPRRFLQCPRVPTNFAVTLLP